MKTWYYYIRTFNPPVGYWSMHPPYQIEDKMLASINGEEMPSKSPFEMQAEQTRQMARTYNPYL